MTRPGSRTLAVLALAAIASAAHADAVAYSNYDVGDPDDLSGFVYIFNSSADEFRFGFSFVSEASGAITEVDAGLFSSSLFDTPATFHLFNDDGSGLPGDPIGTLTASVNRNDPFHFVAPDDSLVLEAGMTYHLVLVRPAPGGSALEWFVPDSPESLPQVYQNALNDPWMLDLAHTDAGAFEIRVTPAPSGLALLVAGLLVPRRKRRSLTPA
ncbi:MAG: hypothetical protein R3B57_08965 [Phycisphaerales bacterium]